MTHAIPMEAMLKIWWLSGWWDQNNTNCIVWSGNLYILWSNNLYHGIPRYEIPRYGTPQDSTFFHVMLHKLTNFMWSKIVESHDKNCNDDSVRLLVPLILDMASPIMYLYALILWNYEKQVVNCQRQVEHDTYISRHEWIMQLEIHMLIHF